MISHEYRCIFVHIPRTGGSSVERWLVGRNWWAVEPETKHLTARQARAIYADVWDDYFKFSIVRHPLDRVLSMMHYAAEYGLALTQDGGIDFAGYKAAYGFPVTVEFDTGHYAPETVRHAGHLPGQIYGNILDCPLDAIYRFETLAQDMDALGRRLGVAQAFSAQPHRLARSEAPKPDRDNPKTRAAVAELYARDFVHFGYTP